MQSVQAIGYKELHHIIEGKISLDDAVQLIKKNTRNYAKRQMTYFRNKLDVAWFERNRRTDEIIKEILKVLKDFDSFEGERNTVEQKIVMTTGGA